jgi:hypothetical protein
MRVLRLLIILLPFGLSACASKAGLTPESRDDNYVPPPLPPNYRALIAADMKALPAFAKGFAGAVISSPGVGLIGRAPHQWQYTKANTICVKYGLAGGFLEAGAAFEHRRVYWFVDGKLQVDDFGRTRLRNSVDNIEFGLKCPNRTYEPFTEVGPAAPEVIRRRMPVDPASPDGANRADERFDRARPAQ